VLLETYNNLRTKHFPDGSYKGDFFTMATGRIIGQTIPILLTPLLTRLYSPAEFGVFAIFVAITAVLSLLANGRYNLAIMLPEKNESVLSLFALSVLINFIFCLLLLIIILIFQTPLLELFNLKSSPEVLYLLPLGTFVIGFFEPLHYLAVRNRLFKVLSGNMIFQFTLIAILKIGFAFLAIGGLGLIMGHLIGYIAGISLFTFLLLRKNVFVGLRNSVAKAKLFNVANVYKKFPMYSLPADTLQAFSKEIPNLLINNFFGGAILGYFSLTQRVLASPITLISSAITDVFREKASGDLRQQGSCKNVFVKTFQKLFIFSILPFTLLFLFAPAIVPFVFGQEWAPAGEYIRIMTILFFLRFSIAPVSSVLYLTGKQIYKLGWEVLSFVFVVSSFYVGYRFFDQYVAIGIYSFNLSFLYIILLFISYKFTEDISFREKE
jgi:O-antigen/teichoic acid export membrane protein